MRDKGQDFSVSFPSVTPGAAAFGRDQELSVLTPTGDTTLLPLTPLHLVPK